jgi:predicted RNA binding protein YcfA (HicA-like mRNA interferase family)
MSSRPTFLPRGRRVGVRPGAIPCIRGRRSTAGVGRVRPPYPGRGFFPAARRWAWCDGPAADPRLLRALIGGRRLAFATTCRGYPGITSEATVRALRAAGWQEVRRRGSHVILHHASRPGRVTVPVHAGVILKPKTLLSILEQAGVRVEEFVNLL